MSSKSINELSLNSISITNSNYSKNPLYVAQENTLTTNNAGVLLVNGVPISSGGGGSVDDITAGTGITVDEVSTGVFKITNNGVLNVTAGTGIDVTETSTGVFEITNTGVINITAGNGIDVAETSAGIFEITNTGGGLQPTQSFFSIADSTPKAAVNTEFQIITQADDIIPPAGLYIMDICFLFESYNASDALAAGIGSVNLQFYSYLNGTTKNLLYPTSAGGGQDQVIVQGSVVVECDGISFLGVQAKCLEFTGSATQIAVRKPFGGLAPNLVFTKIA